MKMKEHEDFFELGDIKIPIYVSPYCPNDVAYMIPKIEITTGDMSLEQLDSVIRVANYFIMAGQEIKIDSEEFYRSIKEAIERIEKLGVKIEGLPTKLVRKDEQAEE